MFDKLGKAHRLDTREHSYYSDGADIVRDVR